MEQAISKLPTSKFHATASEPQLVPTRLDFLSASYGRSSGSSSSIDGGRSWEERILDLSAELQQICGSPVTPPCFGGSPAVGACSQEQPQWPSPTQTRSTATSPRVVPSTAVSASSVSDRRSGQWSSTTPSRLTSSLGRYTTGNSTADLVRRAISCQGRQSSDAASGRPRPIIVRHEETQETLAQRLSAICGQSSQAVAAGGTTDRRTTSATDEQRRASSKLRADVTAAGDDSDRVRIKADVLPYRVEDVVVAVCDGRRLTIDVYDGSATRRLHGAELPPGVADHLLCHMTSSGSVYVHERPRGTGLSVEFCGAEPAFLPVIHCDEDQLVMTLVLRVPDDVGFEDLAVKTVDSSVWITGGGGKRGASPLSESCDAFSFPSRHGSRLTDGARRRFRVVVPLPKGCDNRSVVAALSSNNQLVLKARLSSACRRYTF